MSDLGPSGLARQTLAETTFVVFQRVIALYCIMFGVLYWIRLIGLYGGPLWRFDLMPAHWQIAASCLAVLFPFAGIGLWMLSSWGPVIWFICAAAETAMYVGLPSLFGSRPQIAGLHLAVALLYLAFRVVIAMQRRRAAERG